jgi:hypothetical protein
MRVVFLPRFRGTLPNARCSPFGARARSRVMEVWVPHSRPPTRTSSAPLLPPLARGRPPSLVLVALCGA